VSVPTELIERTSRRLLRYRQLNDLGFFLPLGVAIGALCRFVLTVFSLPATFALVPLVICGGLLAFALWRTRKVVEQTTVAALLDEKTGGQERFLTLATCPQTQANRPFLALVDQQAARQSASFEPKRDVSFKLDKRVPITVLAAALSVLLLFFSPPILVDSGPGTMPTPDALMADLETIARQLMTKGTTPQEQAAGVQLLALAQELQDPAISPQEKRRLIDDAQQRMKLNLPLPQILPFDLKLFASESKEDKGQGNQGDQPQPENKPLAKADQNLEQLKKTLSAAAGNEPQPGPQKEGEQQKQPRQDGGGIKFDMPQPQSGKQQKQAGQEPSGQQQSSQAQTPNSQESGTDPNRPGGQKDQSRGQEQGPKQDPAQTGPQEKGKGSTIGGSPGERFLQPGEQAGGFLTEDARFVKVRIPVGEEAPGEGEKRTENRSPALPQVPYSNAPLKEGPSDQAQPQQPVPLEYRKILQQ
jgi:hypothetical protein